MFQTREHIIDDELYIEPHFRLRNMLILNDGPGRLSVLPGDGRESHHIGIPAGDGLVVFDPDGVGAILVTDAPQTSVTVTHVFSRALYARGSAIEPANEPAPGTGKRRLYKDT